MELTDRKRYDGMQIWFLNSLEEKIEIGTKKNLFFLQAVEAAEVMVVEIVNEWMEID